MHPASSPTRWPPRRLALAPAAGASIVFGPAGWIIGGAATGFTAYRSWRKAKRKQAQFVLDQATETLQGTAVELRQALDDARDRVVARLDGLG